MVNDHKRSESARVSNFKTRLMREFCKKVISNSKFSEDTKTHLNKVLDLINDKLLERNTRAFLYDRLYSVGHQLETRKGVEKEVITRLCNGHWVTSIDGRLWWHTPSKTLESRCSLEDFEALNRLKSQGIVELTSVTIQM